MQRAGLTPETILSLVALIALLSALLQILYGVVGGGRLIKFIPIDPQTQPTADYEFDQRIAW